MIFKKRVNKVIKPPFIGLLLERLKNLKENEVPAIAGIAIARLSRAGKESVE